MEALQTWLSGTSEKIAIYIETRKKNPEVIGRIPSTEKSSSEVPLCPTVWQRGSILDGSYLPLGWLAV